MSRIVLDRVCVQFPMYDVRHRSLKGTLLSATTGGRIRSADGEVPLIEGLSNVSLRIDDGERVALLGPNGAGKTTLLRVIAGVYRPVTGSAQVQGAVTSLLDPTFGMSMESTGWENISLRALYLGLDRQGAQALADDVATFSELGDYLAMPVRAYSAGMMLRLAFAMSTAMEPDILLMDEWLSTGDAAFREKAQARMRKLVDSARILVIATHDLALVEALCGRLVQLERGQIHSDQAQERVSTSFGTPRPSTRVGTS